MKTYQEIHDAIEECKHSLRGSDSALMWDILHAMHERITALETAISATAQSVRSGASKRQNTDAASGPAGANPACRTEPMRKEYNE